MPGHVGFVFFPNKIETKHDDSTTIKKYINRPFGPSALRSGFVFGQEPLGMSFGGYSAI
jgi:hypothetical protein